MNKFFLLLLLSLNINPADSETTDLKQKLAELIENFNKEKCEGLSPDEIINELEQIIKNGKN